MAVSHAGEANKMVSQYMRLDGSAIPVWYCRRLVGLQSTWEV